MAHFPCEEQQSTEPLRDTILGTTDTVAQTRHSKDCPEPFKRFDGSPGKGPGALARELEIDPPRADGPTTDGSIESQPVRALFTSLRERHVRYCHWKSNVRLAGTLSGDEDIDLLVDPRDATILQSAIAENGYKLAVGRNGSGHPAVFHALALDETSSRLVDLHAYHQLVSGDSLLKNYRFPVEEQLLANTGEEAHVKVPAASAELPLFVIRILLKHASFIEARKVNLKYGKTTRELAWLLERSDIDEAAAICRNWFPTLSPPLRDMIAAVARPELIVRRVMLALTLGRDLRHLRRMGAVSLQIGRIQRLFRNLANRYRQRSDRCLLSGGVWIAITGSKGTGKSTIARGVQKAFSRHLDVAVIHIGKPPRTLASSLLCPLIAAAWRIVPARRPSEFQNPEKREERRYPLLYILFKLLVARDRARLITRATRAVTAGTIVLSDRCPTTNFTGIDGSAFDDLALERALTPIHRRLMAKEQRIYRNLPRPRLVLKLNADLQTTLLRDHQRQKAGGPRPAAICRRWDLESRGEYEGSTVSIVDANGPLEETLRHCVRRAWDAL